MRKRQQAVQTETRRRRACCQTELWLKMAVILMLLLAAGCGRSPQTTFYTLTPTAAVSDASQLVKPAPSIAIAAVTLPELVDRPQLVVADAGSKVAILESRRWAEPLKSAVPRLLAENLSRLTGAEQVSFYPQHAANKADYRIFADIQRFEATADRVHLDALWSIRSGKTGAPVTGRSKISEPIANAEFETLVTGYSKALATLSRELAQAIRTIQTKE